MISLLYFAAAVAESIVEDVNSDPTSTWVAVEYPPHIMTHAKMLARLGATPAVTQNVPYVNNLLLPTDFDARDKWGDKILPVRNQGACGSCWAFAITEAWADRLHINGQGVGSLSPQDYISCDNGDDHCYGGNMARAYNWAKTHGVATEKCMPYKSGNGRVPPCPSKCEDGSEIKRYFLKGWTVLKANQIQEEVYDHGPVSTDFIVYSDFMSYRSGVYHHKFGVREGGHAVNLIGWGVESGTPYWLCQNSWGTNWGENGFFKIIRGINDCNIETDCIAVTF